MKQIKIINLLAFLFLASVSKSHAQTAAFTYQGLLNDTGRPANGSYDLIFQVIDVPCNPTNGGVVIGAAIYANGIGITNGLFTRTLDFGVNVFTGPDRWLEITVRTNGGSQYYSLCPRQLLTATPYAVYANSAGTVTNGAIGNAQLTANAVAVTNIQNSIITAGKIAPGQVVKNLNGLTDAVALTQGSNVTITTNGNSLQISAPAGGLALPYSGSSPGSPAFTVSNSSSGTAISGLSSGAGSRGVFGAGDYGVYGEADAAAGYGVFGVAYSGAPNSIGVSGVAPFGAGVGVYGTGGDYGVRGHAPNAGGRGVLGTSAAMDSVAIRGFHQASGNEGQLGRYDSGVLGVHSNGNSGQLGTVTHGVYGIGTSNSAGVHGAVSPTGASGSLGISLSGGAVGVYGYQGFGDMAGLFRGRVAITNVYGGNALRIEKPEGPSAALYVHDGGEGFAAQLRSDYCTALDVRGGGGCYAAQFIGALPAGRGIQVSGESDFYGDFTVWNGSKSAIVPTSQGHRKLYCEESSQVWFAEYGSAQLTNGSAVIVIDALFAETVNLHRRYHVFVQLNDANCEGVAVINRQPDTFEVRERRGGLSNAEFSYRIVAMRRGFEDTRLELASAPPPSR